MAKPLIPHCCNFFRNPARGELAKTLAPSLLADYAAKDPSTLTELVLAADAVSDKSLFPVLQQHQTAAVNNLEAVLDQRLEPDWKNSPLDPAWTEPSPAVRAQIESAHGLITERFAFCQDKPLAKFIDVAEWHRASRYRPTRVHPWKAHHAERDGYIPGIWSRDNLRWHIDPGLKKSELPAPEAAATKDDLLLTDIAPLPLADEAAEPQFIALWCEARSVDATAPGADGSGGEQRRVLIDVTEAEFTAAQTVLTQQGFKLQCTITDAAKESLALQQAAAATALLRLNAPEKVWPLFHDQPDPRVRSYVLHRLATYDVDPQSLITQLLESDQQLKNDQASRGRQSPDAASVNNPGVDTPLAKRYADDPAPGVHGAAEWTLRQLGADAVVVSDASLRLERTRSRWHNSVPFAVSTSLSEPTPAKKILRPT